MATSLFDSTIANSTGQALDFIGNILESSTKNGQRFSSRSDGSPARYEASPIAV